MTCGIPLTNFCNFVRYPIEYIMYILLFLYFFLLRYYALNNAPLSNNHDILLFVIEKPINKPQI